MRDLLISAKPVSASPQPHSALLSEHLIDAPHVPSHWHLRVEERNIDFQTKNMQMRTALPQSAQISQVSFFCGSLHFFFSGECEAAKPHCRTIAIKTNSVAIEIAILATISPALLSAELSTLCCQWDRPSNGQMAEDQNYAFLLDKLFAYTGISCYAGSSLMAVLNKCLLLIKGWLRLHSTLGEKLLDVVLGGTERDISSSVSCGSGKGVIQRILWYSSRSLRCIQTNWIALPPWEVFHSLWLTIPRSSDNPLPYYVQVSFVYNHKIS